jgi:hypothetical protein
MTEKPQEPVDLIRVDQQQKDGGDLPDHYKRYLMLADIALAAGKQQRRIIKAKNKPLARAGRKVNSAYSAHCIERMSPFLTPYSCGPRPRATMDFRRPSLLRTCPSILP